MKLMVGVHSLDSCIETIQRGADEIYLATRSPLLQNLSFSGRGCSSAQVESVIPSPEEMPEIVHYAHERSVEVAFLANLRFLSEGLKRRWLKVFLDYVRKGVDAGVDSIIVGSIAAAVLLRDAGIDLPLIASTFLTTTNSHQVSFLKSLGFNRIVLPYQIKIAEVAELGAVNGIETEAFGLFGCSFFNGHCSLLHDYGESSPKNDFGIGVPCKGQWEIEACGRGSGLRGSLFDAELACALCQIPSLIRAKVGYLKLATRGRDKTVTHTATDLFRYGIDRAIACQESEGEFRGAMRDRVPQWWKRHWCQSGKCKYVETKTSKFFI